MNSRQAAIAKHRQMVDDWNANYEIGIPVTWDQSPSAPVTTKTNSAAELRSGHTAVIGIDPPGTIVPLSKVKPAVDVTTVLERARGSVVGSSADEAPTPHASQPSPQNTPAAARKGRTK